LARIEELEDALLDAQTRLEEERSELEGLRSDATGTAAANVAEDLKQANKQLEALKLEKVTTNRALAEAQTVQRQSAELIEQLRADLRAAEKELEGLQLAGDAAAATAMARAASLEAESSLQREVAELKTRLQEVEKKSEREIKALNQEVRFLRSSAYAGCVLTPGLALQVSELESLVESKIYREDELEAQVERYKKLANKAAPISTTATSGASKRKEDPSLASRDEEDGGCEMCGEGGHDLDSCPICECRFAGNSMISFIALTCCGPLS
jgi:chromosome segregation ATPase